MQPGAAAALTLSTGRTFPAVLADAGEGVSPSHAGSTIGARAGGTCAVLGWVEKRERVRMGKKK